MGRAAYSSRRADAAHAPASLVKLMTLYLAYEEIAAGRARFDDRVTISRYAALTPHPRLPLREGDTLSLSSVLAMVTVRSSNAAATALAEHLAGDEAAFVVRMNRARRRSASPPRTSPPRTACRTGASAPRPTTSRGCSAGCWLTIRPRPRS